MGATMAIRPTDMIADELSLRIQRLVGSITGWFSGLFFQEGEPVSDGSDPVLKMDDDSESFLIEHGVSSSSEPTPEPEGEKPEEPEPEKEAGEEEEPPAAKADDEKPAETPGEKEEVEPAPAAEPEKAEEPGPVEATLTDGTDHDFMLVIVGSVANAISEAAGDKVAFVKNMAKAVGLNIGDVLPNAEARPAELDRSALLVQALERMGYTVEQIADSENIVEPSEMLNAENWADNQMIMRGQELSSFDSKQESAQRELVEKQDRDFDSCAMALDTAVAADKMLSGLEGDDKATASEMLNNLTLAAFYSGETPRVAAEKSARQLSALLNNRKTVSAMERRASRKAVPGQAGATSKQPQVKLAPAVPHSDQWRVDSEKMFEQADSGVFPEGYTGPRE